MTQQPFEDRNPPVRRSRVTALGYQATGAAPRPRRPALSRQSTVREPAAHQPGPAEPGPDRWITHGGSSSSTGVAARMLGAAAVAVGVLLAALGLWVLPWVNVDGWLRNLLDPGNADFGALQNALDRWSEYGPNPLTDLGDRYLRTEAVPTLVVGGLLAFGAAGYHRSLRLVTAVLAFLVAGYAGWVAIDHALSIPDSTPQRLPILVGIVMLSLVLVALAVAAGVGRLRYQRRIYPTVAAAVLFGAAIGHTAAVLDLFRAPEIEGPGIGALAPSIGYLIAAAGATAIAAAVPR